MTAAFFRGPKRAGSRGPGLRHRRARQAARTDHDRGSSLHSGRGAMSYLLQYARRPDSLAGRSEPVLDCSSKPPARVSTTASSITPTHIKRRCGMSYLKRHGTRRVPQWAPLPGQAPNSTGGFAWAVDAWTRLRRFLVLGSEGGSYYASEWSLTRENAKAVEECVREDGLRAVAEIARVSTEGRAPKNDPALYALALAAGLGDDDTRKAALAALPQVARTGTHLFQFASFVEGFCGWGRSLRRAVAGWYAGQPADALAYQAVKYRQRAGVTHRDLLRLAHPAVRVGAGNPTVDVTDEHARLFEWIVP